MKNSLLKVFLLYFSVSYTLVLTSQPAYAFRYTFIVEMINSVRKFSGKFLESTDDIYTLVPLLATIFSKLSGFATTLGSAIYARTKTKWSRTYWICFCIGIAGGLWTAKELFNCSLRFTVEIDCYLRLFLGAVCGALFWMFIAFAKTNDDEA